MTVTEVGSAFQVLMIVCSVVAAILWAISGAQPLTLTLDAMRDEQALAALCNVLGHQ